MTVPLTSARSIALPPQPITIADDKLNETAAQNLD
jgi:hypothetical protein